MNTGEIWCLSKSPVYTIWDNPVDSFLHEYEYEKYDLQRGDCFTVLDVIGNDDREYQFCILFDNRKWYLEVAKSSVAQGLFKKL